jgi:sugar lactone lactonase YvrE
MTASLALSALPVPLAALGEGPIWDAREQALYWVDIPAFQVHRLAQPMQDPPGPHATWHIGEEVGAVVPRASGGLVLAARSGFLGFDPADGATTSLVPLDLGAGMRMNDGACDAAGRFFAGTMADDEAEGAGTLYRLDPDHSVHTVLTGVSVSNGIGWSPDNSLMYYVDSPSGQVDVLDFDVATGAVSGRRALASIDAGPAVPDGLTVDAEGCIWVALWDGGAVLRLGPDGAVLQAIELPAPRVTSCAFGGPDLETLFISTAADDDGTRGGQLFRCVPGPVGQPTYAYRG